MLAENGAQSGSASGAQAPVEDGRVALLLAEVFDLAGKRLFDSGPTLGNTLDRTMITAAGERDAHGLYLLSVQSFSGVALQGLTPNVKEAMWELME